MKNLEMSYLVFKNLLAILIAISVLTLVAKPAWVAAGLFRIEEGLKVHGYRLHLEILGLARDEETEAVESLPALELRIEQLETAIRCLNDNVGCTDDQKEQAKITIQEFTPATRLTVGREEAIDVTKAWVVFAGSDRTFAEALHERGKLADAENADTIFAANRYRTVAVFKDRESATSALSTINEITGRSDAYVRLLQGWCTGFKRMDSGNDTYLECTRNVID